MIYRHHNRQSRLFLLYRLTYDTDDHILQRSQIWQVLQHRDSMIRECCIRRVDAEKILAAFSAYTGGTWSFDNVKVALLPTFSDLHTIHNFNLDTLAKDAGVPYAVLDMMLTGHAVSPQDAHLVLQIASRLASKHYTLETVDIPLLNRRSL